MITQFRHYSDEELLKFIRAEPNDLLAEGELVRRVLADEWDYEVRDEENDELRADLEKAEENISKLEEQHDELKQEIADLKDALEDARATA
jgi:chromosome segregation ATPase